MKFKIKYNYLMLDTIIYILMPVYLHKCLYLLIYPKQLTNEEYKQFILKRQ